MHYEMKLGNFAENETDAGVWHGWFFIQQKLIFKY
jgi:hypothetical protein